MIGLTFIARATRSPLFVFFVCGAAIFAIAPKKPARTVDLPSATLAALRDAEIKRAAVRMEAPHADEVDARAIEDEMLYREALRMSLDKGDAIVRQRMIEKLLLLVEDLGGASRTPTDAELQAYFDETSTQWRKPARIHFIHVFSANRDALPLLTALDPAAQQAPALGESFPYARDATLTNAEMARIYKGNFADDVARLGDAWSEPIASSFGWHRVRVVERIPGAPAKFEDVKREMVLDFMLARREKIVGAYLTKLASQYDIRVDGKPLQGFVPTRRIAVRVDPSAED